mmetsp:Transcript_17827/g.38806  ORF Transcript_17827/g.38806 Transcript_17827/m.38806 type:complete len:150 (+) Transcript_17827:76-525(+)
MHTSFTRTEAKAKSKPRGQNFESRALVESSAEHFPAIHFIQKLATYLISKDLTLCIWPTNSFPNVGRRKVSFNFFVLSLVEESSRHLATDPPVVDGLEVEHSCLDEGRNTVPGALQFRFARAHVSDENGRHSFSSCVLYVRQEEDPKAA